MGFMTVGIVCLCIGWKVRGYLERVRGDRPCSVWDLCLADSMEYRAKKKRGEG
jgi:hypothetical protein